VSPSGDTSFVFGATVWDQQANKKTTNLWLSKYGIIVTAARLAPQDYVSDFNAQFTSDGKTVLFLSTRGDSGAPTNIWAINLDDPDTAYKVSQHSTPTPLFFELTLC
jgi:dipeptidyl aminopeptidase/acylaminoacyl peptidase